jgi:hypothetical protein
MIIKSVLTVVSAIALLSGCGLSAASQPPAGCPAGGWDAALVWSSGTDPAGDIAFVRGGEVVGRQSLPFQGLDPAPSDGIFRTVGAAWLKSNGDTGRDRTTVLRYDTRACAAEGHRVDEQVIRAVIPHAEGFVTTNTVNGEARVIRRDGAGKVVATSAFPDLTVTALRENGDAVLALGSTMGTESDTAVLLELDGTTLKERRRVTLDGVVGSDDLVVRGDRLYYPKTVVRRTPGGAEVEGSALGVVTLSDLGQSEVDLGTPAPAVLAADELVIYVAHTFMNPSFRDPNEYHTVTRLDTATGAVQSFDAGPGLLSIAVRGDRLFAVNQVDRGTPTVTTYRLPDFTRIASATVPPPQGQYFYVAGLLAP